MTDTPISLADLRDAAEAWERESTTPGYYGTDAYHALEDVLLGDGSRVVLALVEAVSAAQAHIELLDASEGTDLRLGATEEALRAALSRFASEQPPNGDKSSETGA